MEAQALSDQAQALSDQAQAFDVQRLLVTGIASKDIDVLFQCEQLINELLRPKHMSFLEPRGWKEEFKPEVNKVRDLALEIEDKLRELQLAIDDAAQKCIMFSTKK